MSPDQRRMTLSASAVAEAQQAHSSAVDEFLAPEQVPANVVGLGVGVKWSKGEPTGRPALVVLVSQKLDRDQLRPEDMVPPKLADMQTDVLAIGYPFAGGGEVLQTGTQALVQRARPAQGGRSVGHVKITAGTIATCVYDILPGGGTSPPNHGILRQVRVRTVHDGGPARPPMAPASPGRHGAFRSSATPQR